MQDTVVIVDGYSTGRFLAKEFSLLGAKTIHVQSRATPPAVLAPSFDPAAYEEVHPFACDPVTVAEWLRFRSPTAVVPGCDTGVELADSLSRLLGLPGNSPASSRLRRHKVAMAAAVRAKGLSAPLSFEAFSASAALAWARTTAAHPVVVRPCDGAGSNGLYFCKSPADLERAIDGLLGSRNLLDLPIDSVAVQAYAPGRQFVINTVTLGGAEHFVTDIWQVELRERGMQGVERIGYSFVGRDHPHARSLCSFAKKVLDALEVEYGAADLDVRVVDAGPTLIELNARIMGATMKRDVLVDTLGHSHASALACGILRPWVFETLFDGEYALDTRLDILTIPVGGRGRVRSTSGLDRIRGLPSFKGFDKAPSIGDLVRPATDTTGSNGFVYLSHLDGRQHELDKSAALEILSSGAAIQLEQPMQA
jgi:hypothetical protein